MCKGMWAGGTIPHVFVRCLVVRAFWEWWVQELADQSPLNVTEEEDAAILLGDFIKVDRSRLVDLVAVETIHAAVLWALWTLRSERCRQGTSPPLQAYKERALENVRTALMADLHRSRRKEAESYVTKDEKAALAVELAAMTDPMERRARKDEQKLAWKLRMKREKKRRREEVNKMTATVAKVQECRAEVLAQPDDKAKWDKVLGYLEVLSKAWMEERQASWSQDVALSAMRSGLRDFAHEIVTHIGGEVKHLRDDVGKFCEGAIQGAKAVAAVEGEARPLAYLDDILVFSKTLKEHQGHLRQVLEKLREANFKINAKKCEWAKTQVLYLGHVLDGDGIKPEDSKIAAIRDWPTPRTLTELRSFLGRANYYRKFVRNFSTIVAPLRRLLKKEAIWQWDKDSMSALKKLKRALIEYPVLKVADPSFPFVVTTDVSQYGIGAVLQQDDGNGYRPVEFMSARMPYNVFGPEIKTEEIYRTHIQDIILNSIDGFNATVFAYGQTSSGKTFTMRGGAAESGIIPLAVQDVFVNSESGTDREYLIRVAYMEIYNEEINDLLAPESKKLQVHESPERGFFVAGLREEIVTNPERVLELMEIGERNRHFGETNMNQNSSRSHTIFRMVIESRDQLVDEQLSGPPLGSSDAVRVATLNLVDLAGSERITKTGSGGERMKEGTFINKSLHVLGKVINKLSEGSDRLGLHIPYRESSLTRILQPALGGNSKTAIICNVTPSAIHIEETKTTLQFASRAKKVTNCAQVNEVLTDAAVLKRQAHEIEDLKKKLQAVNSAEINKQIQLLRNQLLKAELEAERMALELEEQKAENERKIKEQQQKIRNLSSMVINSASDGHQEKRANRVSV
ncbi:hypothetical protein CBR_g23545 [Chara braunii]|uniref:Kinesin-like protein n=1 Tax=Chara braunii TaxID=69332 RepID=A0A388L4P7_CHABU|nr:hypothetical protein CBR_g23545 [Chara braunii]|eukprot:GBG77218.1 hypothetical protein CBR_g23545 [Chara braunii]